MASTSPSNQTLDDGDSNNNGSSSFFQPTVCLHDWWLLKTENDDVQGKRLAVAGVTSRVKEARRVFSSAPITKRFDVFNLETADGVSIIIKGFINKRKTTENGFPSETFSHFLFGFPSYWEEFVAKFLEGDSTTSCADSGSISETVPKTDQVSHPGRERIMSTPSDSELQEPNEVNVIKKPDFGCPEDDLQFNSIAEQIQNCGNVTAQVGEGESDAKQNNTSRKRTKRKKSFDAEETPPAEVNREVSIVSPESLNLKRSRTGRLLLPPMEFWRNQVPIYDADHTVSGIMEELPARSVEARVRDNQRYKPKEILQDIRDQHGKERRMAALHGTFEGEYHLLPAYCEQIRKTNPGSIASVFASGQENCFRRLFISYRASIHGFIHACRPLLELDSAHLKGKYLGSLLCAAAVDPDDALFPLAIAIVDIESDENWMWFMSELRKLLEVNTDNMPRLTILSERQRGLVEAVETHFPSAFHGFCLRYVSENFCDTFKNAKLVNIFWNAVYAPTAVEFDSKISEMTEISQDVKPWFQHFPPQLWAVAYFEGVRYGHFTLDVTELLYNWALECRELPIVQMMEHIRHQLSSWYNDRRKMCMRWTSILVPSAQNQILEAMPDARSYYVLRATEFEFEIVSTEETNAVDIQTRMCSCRRWHIYGLPCAHAAAALFSCGHNVYLFAEPCFTVASYRETYSQMIHPIPDKSLWKKPGDGTEGGGAEFDIMIRPPKTQRSRGRPKRVHPIERVVQCAR